MIIYLLVLKVRKSILPSYGPPTGAILGITAAYFKLTGPCLTGQFKIPPNVQISKFFSSYKGEPSYFTSTFPKPPVIVCDNCPTTIFI